MLGIMIKRKNSPCGQWMIILCEATLFLSFTSSNLCVLSTSSNSVHGPQKPSGRDTPIKVKVPFSVVLS